MADKDNERLMRHLIHLCEKISQERCGNPGELFELTKTAKYPQVISELAESFGMMMVKVDVREYRLEQIVDEYLAHENIALKRNLKAEELLIKNALKDAGGNKTGAARTLGLSREGLRKKLKKYALDS